MCDVTHSHVSRDSFIYKCDMTRPNVWHDSSMLECDVTYSYIVRHDPSSSQVCDMTHPYVRHDSSLYTGLETESETHFMCVTWPIHMCDMTDTICVTWSIHMCDMTHSYVIWPIDICVRHDPFIRVNGTRQCAVTCHITSVMWHVSMIWNVIVIWMGHVTIIWYRVATISRLLKIIGLFCTILSLL